MDDTIILKIYHIVAIILFVFVFAILLTNSVYYYRLQQNPSSTITKNEANILFYFNILMAVLVFGMFLWSIVNLVVYLPAGTSKSYLIKKKTTDITPITPMVQDNLYE